MTSTLFRKIPEGRIARRRDRVTATLAYPAVYLVLGGLGLFVAPRLTLTLMLSNGEYGDVFPRLAGALLIGLGLLVAQIARNRIRMLYPTLVGVRGVFCASYLFLFAKSHDPLFLVLLVMVGSGALMTWMAIRSERGERA